MNNHEMIYLKLKRGKTNSLFADLDDTTSHLAISRHNPKKAAKEIEIHLDYWRDFVGNIIEIEINDFRSNLSAKSSIPEDCILTVETLAEKIKDLRLEIFEEFNGYIEL